MVASPPTRTLDLGRDVAGAAGRGPAGARPPRLGAPFPGQVLEQGRESAVEDLRRVAAGDRVAQEVLRAPRPEGRRPRGGTGLKCSCTELSKTGRTNYGPFGTEHETRCDIGIEHNL